MLCDSGCRAGEFVSMRVSDVKFEEVDGRLRGRVIIYDAKAMASRFAYFGHDAVRAIDTGAKTTVDTVS
jgi:site-specific recombinase XerD